MFCEMAGQETSNRAAISPAERSPSHTSRRIRGGGGSRPPRARPARTPWRHMDPSNDPVWIGGISERTARRSPAPRGLRRPSRRPFPGKRIDYVLRIERMEEGAVLAMRSVKAPFPMAVEYAFEDAPASTLVRIRVTGEPGGLYRLASSKLAAKTREGIAGDLERLAGVLESRPRRPPASGHEGEQVKMRGGERASAPRRGPDPRSRRPARPRGRRAS